MRGPPKRQPRLAGFTFCQQYFHSFLSLFFPFYFSLLLFSFLLFTSRLHTFTMTPLTVRLVARTIGTRSQDVACFSLFVPPSHQAHRLDTRGRARPQLLDKPTNCRRPFSHFVFPPSAQVDYLGCHRWLPLAAEAVVWRGSTAHGCRNPGQDIYCLPLRSLDSGFIYTTSAPCS